MSTTWHARTSAGDMIVVRDTQGELGGTVYEIHCYAGEISLDPREQPIPEQIPDELGSREEAIKTAYRFWSIEEVLPSPTSGPLTIDLEILLRTGRADPISMRMSHEHLLALLGLPDALGQSASGGAWWLYGSVVVHIQRQTLTSLEVDCGDDTFTSIRFSNWFLKSNSTAIEIEAELTKRSVSFTTQGTEAQKTILTPLREQARCLFDFDESGVIHGFYWVDSGDN